MVFVIVEDVIDIARNADAGNDVGGFGIEDDQRRRAPAPDENAVTRFIERDWKIGRRARCFPSRHYGSFVAVDHCYVVRARDVYEDSAALFLKGKSFGMTRESDGPERLAVGRVGDGDPSIAKAREDLPGRRIVSDIIGIITEVELAQRLVRFSVVKFADPAFVARHKQAIQPGYVGDSLRRPKTGDGVNAPVLAQVDYLDGIVAEGTDEEPFTCRVDIHVVDAPFYSRQRNRRLELKCSAFRLCRRRPQTKPSENGAETKRVTHVASLQGSTRRESRR